MNKEIPPKPNQALKRGYQWVLVNGFIGHDPRTGEKVWRDPFWQQRKKHIGGKLKKPAKSPDKKSLTPIPSNQNEAQFWKERYFDALEVIKKLA